MVPIGEASAAADLVGPRVIAPVRTVPGEHGHQPLKLHLGAELLREPGEAVAAMPRA